ncbi:hypothetical protein CHISP_1256 [Chitinispirillum alkaliphilum]|nr:hypothetical protein CHISP_1256 [Chitinispirillum alkaliphilum]
MIVKLIFSMLFVLGLTSPAYCYIDMGTGSYVLQIVIASVLGSLYAVKLYWKKILSLFGRGKKQDKGIQG